MDKFQFKGFEPNEDLRRKVEDTLGRIVEGAPADAKVTLSLDHDGARYHCAIEVGSSSCPVSVETSHKFASVAVEKAEQSLTRRLERWRGPRFAAFEETPFRAPLRPAM